MNRSRVWLFGVALILGSSLPCLANEIQGLIRSIDTSNNAIVIDDMISGTGQTVHVHPRVIQDIKEGDVVKLSLKSGSNNAEILEVLPAR